MDRYIFLPIKKFYGKRDRVMLSVCLSVCLSEHALSKPFCQVFFKKNKINLFFTLTKFRIIRG